MEEIWRPVPYQPFDKAYSVSNLGRIRPNVVSRYSKNKAEFLKPGTTPKGYLVVTLYYNGMSKWCQVHRLVALAFLGEPPMPEHVVCHKDDCKSHNSIDNLEWGTTKHNAATREAIGKTSRGIGNGRAHLTEDDVRAIRRTYAAGGISQTALAAVYGVEQTRISSIVLGKSWRHVT